MRVVARKRMRGVSELVVIISILLVAIVAVFAFRGWLASQQQRLGQLDMASASYSVQYTTPSTAVVSLLVRNNLPGPLRVVGFNITLSNGTVLGPASTGVATAPSLPASVSAKSDALITITVSGLAPGVAVRDVNVLVEDPSTGQTQWIKAVGG
ncbi:MAG: hypothetical protein QXF05_04795 [Thermofilaceae archaeon]